MSTQTVKLTAATLEQLRYFARMVLGLEVHNFSKEQKIIAQIKAVYAKDEFNVEVSDEAPEKEPCSDPEDPQTPTQELDEYGLAIVEEPYYVIVIAEQEGPGGQDPVPVSPNGRNMWIERGKEQRIKHRYWHILMNASQTVYEQPDGAQGDMVPREVLSYPVSTVERPSAAELAAWTNYGQQRQTAAVIRKAKLDGLSLDQLPR